VLQSQGNFTLFEASNGQEALQLIYRELPDLIILDLMMPEMDGFSVLEHLKNASGNIPNPGDRRHRQRTDARGKAEIARPDFKG
jgi:CheY-like chemotaxis protein